MERSKAGVEILVTIERGLERDPKTLPKIERDRRSTGGGATVELLKVLLRQVSESHGVAAKMIATVEDLGSDRHGGQCRRRGTVRLAARAVRDQSVGIKAWPSCPDPGAGQGGDARMAG